MSRKNDKFLKISPFLSSTINLYEVADLDSKLVCACSDANIDMEKEGISKLRKKVYNILFYSSFRWALKSSNPDVCIPEKLENQIKIIYNDISSIYYSITKECLPFSPGK